MTTRDAQLKLDSTIQNFLSLDEQYFSTGIGSWSATGANIVRNIGFRYRDKYHTLEVTPSSSSPVTLSVETKTLQVVNSYDFITFYMFVYCTKRTQFEVRLSASYGTMVTETVVANAMTWTLVRGPALEVPELPVPATFNLQVIASSHLGAKFYIGHPSLVNTLHIVDNLFLRQCMAYMPEVFIETDRNQILPDYPMLRFLDLGTRYANKAVNQLIDFKYKDIEAGFKENDITTRSKLVDADAADSQYLDWLAQIVGVKIVQVGAGTTPWGNLPSTWEQLTEAVDNPPTGDDDTKAEWDEIERFNPEDAGFSDNRRKQIKDAQVGYNAGTIKSLIISLLEILKETKSYKVYSDQVSSPWTIFVRTLVSETPGGELGQSSQTLLKTLNRSKPMGFVIDHECVSTL